MKINWTKVGDFFKKYWKWIVLVVVIAAAVLVGFKVGWKEGLVTGILGGAASGSGAFKKSIESNSEKRKKRAADAEDKLNKAKGGGTNLPLILLIVILLIFGGTCKAAPGTVPMDEYLKVLDRVTALQAELSSTQQKLDLAIQAAELYKMNWEEAEEDLKLALEQNDLLEKDKLTLITKITEIQSKKFGVQAMIMYDGELNLALAGTYKNFILGATYNVKDQIAGIMAGIKVDF